MQAQKCPNCGREFFKVGEPCAFCGAGEDVRVRAFFNEVELFRQLAERTREGVLRWTPQRKLQSGWDGPMRLLEAKHGGLTITLDRLPEIGESQEYLGYMVSSDLFEDHLFPGDGIVFLHPEGQDAFLRLWDVVGEGVDWDAVPVEEEGAEEGEDEAP